MKTKELSIEQQTVRDCPILYNMRYRPCTETCMCWGWEFSNGWDRIVEDASRELEMLNIQYYPKYRVRIQADQIKEKFSTLCFYYSIVQDPCPFVTWLGYKFQSISDFFSNCKRFDYKLIKVYDVEPHDYDEVKELDKKTYDEELACKWKPSNVEYKEDNSKFIKISHMHDYGKAHIEPTRHKLFWKIKEFVRKLSWTLLNSACKDNTAIRNCKKYLEIRADEIIQRAERECEKHCERCGSQIGTDWSPACTTTGWISCICDKCAEKSEKEYYKNGDLWKGKERIKTKEELVKECKEDCHEKEK